MVFRKPYAFLIKNFKLIHIILSALMVYLSIKSNSIFNVYNSLVKNINVSTVGLVSKNFNILLNISIFGVIILGCIIWYLMRIKKKNNRYYLFLVLYYIIYFIFLIILKNGFETLEVTSISNQTLRIYRDISLLFPLPQYYFIVVALLRGIGFNLKQFNFSKDIKELQINEEDSEEIELGVSNNSYKFFREVRKRIREFKYYFLENRFLILIILGIVIFGLLIYVFVNYKFVDNNYSQGTSVQANSYNIKVNNVYIARNNLKGKIIKEGYKYIIVDYNIKNNYYEARKIDLKKFAILLKDKVLYPSDVIGGEFNDLGYVYDNTYLDNENDYNFLMVFEVSDNTRTENIKLRVFDTLDYKTNRVNYVNIKLKPNNIDYERNNINLSLNETIMLDNKFYGNTNFKINNVYYENKYEFKKGEKLGVIVPEDMKNNLLLIIEYELNLDTKVTENLIQDDKYFFNNFVSINYVYNNKGASLNFSAIKNSYVKNKIFIEVPKRIQKYEDVKLTINTRSNSYNYKIK